MSTARDGGSAGMSTAGVRTPSSPVARLVRSACEGQTGRAANSPFANTPYRLLWSTGIIAFVLGIVAFVLWGINGAGTLFDMMVAFCA